MLALTVPSCWTVDALPLPVWVTVAALAAPFCVTAELLLWANAGAAVKSASVEAPARRSFFMNYVLDDALVGRGRRL